MNNNLEYKITKQYTITGKETYETILKFLAENQDCSSIYKIQIDEFKSFLRRKHNISEKTDTEGLISSGMKDLLE